MILNASRYGISSTSKLTNIISRCGLATSSSNISSSMTLNFKLPHKIIYHDTKVAQVIIPGVAGEYGVTAEHIPVISEMKAGVLKIHHEGKSEVEKFFVAGGFSITHANSVTDISCPEAVKLDELDSTIATAAYNAAKFKFSSAKKGSVKQVEAQIEMEVNKSIASALGVM